MTRHSWFQRNPKITLLSINLIIFAALLVGGESILRFGLGLGNPVLYDSNPIYGYRPLPNQETTRFNRALLKFNNLSLRADGDWDERIDNKVLFIGNSVTYGGSYIANDDLFSHLALEGIVGYSSGNAGVNGWGIENMHALIVESEFLPADTYISVVGSHDFYRGLTRLQGLPFWCRKPTFALKEFLFHFYYLQNNKRYIPWRTSAGDELIEKVVEKAVLKLVEMDEFLKSRGYNHLIYFSPSVEQVVNGQEEDPVILKYLTLHDLRVEFLIDRVRELDIDHTTMRNWFHSDIHLEKAGHAVWGRIINQDLKQLLVETGMAQSNPRVQVEQSGD